MAATDGGAGMPQDQKTTDDQHAAVVPGDGGTRASDRERDVVVQRVQDAFAEGRLDDAEFDERSRAALTARTHSDLDALLADLPAASSAPGPAPVLPGPGRFAVALKSSVRRAGRWRVPERYTTVVYKAAAGSTFARPSSAGRSPRSWPWPTSPG